MNNVKLLHIRCCFFQFFNSPVALKNLKKFGPPQEKVEMTLLTYGYNQADACTNHGCIHLNTIQFKNKNAAVQHNFKPRTSLYSSKVCDGSPMKAVISAKAVPFMRYSYASTEMIKETRCESGSESPANNSTTCYMECSSGAKREMIL